MGVGVGMVVECGKTDSKIVYRVGWLAPLLKEPNDLKGLISVTRVPFSHTLFDLTFSINSITVIPTAGKVVTQCHSSYQRQLCALIQVHSKKTYTKEKSSFIVLVVQYPRQRVTLS